MLGLHEGSVVGMATGYALGRNRPALVNVHTTAGLGNAVPRWPPPGSTARRSCSSIGQQDRARRRLPAVPDRRDLERLAGSYPVWVERAGAPAGRLPRRIARALARGATGLGPALVIVPMGDWDAPADPTPTARGAGRWSACRRRRRRPRGRARHGGRGRPVARDGGRRRRRQPRGLGGAGRARGATAVPGLAGGVQRWRRLPAGPSAVGRASALAALGRMRDTLRRHDLVLVVGAAALRRTSTNPARSSSPAPSRVISADPEQLHRSAAGLALLGPPAAPRVRDPRDAVPVRARLPRVPLRAPRRRRRRAAGGRPLQAGHVLDALARRLARRDDACSRRARRAAPNCSRASPHAPPMGFVAPGERRARVRASRPRSACAWRAVRPVVAMLGDGSTIYSIQALWSAARYGVGALFVVMANGRYAVMDALARHAGRRGAWPAFDEVDIGSDRAGVRVPGAADRRTR